MDRRGGCCIAKYDGGGGGGGYYNNRMSEVDLIMLKYRPIAPKPVAGGSGVSGGFAPDNRDLNVKNGRPKRRYKSNNRRCVNRGSKASPEKSSSGGSSETVVTLPLLSETPERKESLKIASPRRKAPIWLSFDRKEIVSDGGGLVSFGGGREAKVAEAVRLVGSCVTVECVTDTWMDGNGLGRTDEEKVMNLDVDTCPGFVSDGYNGVKWTNKAYREMVGGEDTMVWLVMKDLVLLPLMSDAFTCRVKVTCGKDRGGAGALTLPCDVWRLNNGGFAWRLDLKAALSLGR